MTAKLLRWAIAPSPQHPSESTTSLGLRNTCSKQMENMKGPVSAWEEGIFQFPPPPSITTLSPGEWSVQHLPLCGWLHSGSIKGRRLGGVTGNALCSSTRETIRFVSKCPFVTRATENFKARVQLLGFSVPGIL